MNSRRVFREIVKTLREGSAQQALLPNLFGALRLFILFLLISSNSFSQNNVGNQQYDLNDPRNPDCPCHKLQKLADDEYKQMQNKDQQQQFALNVNISDQLDNNFNFNKQDNQVNRQDNTNIGTDNSSHQVKRDFSPNQRQIASGSGSSGSKTKKKKHGLWFQKKINRSKLKNSRIKKVRPNYSVCYKW